MNYNIDIILTKYNKIIQYMRRFGLVSGSILIISLLIGVFKRNIITIRISEFKNIIKMRRHTSDLLVFNQIFLDGDYDLTITIRPKLIIDGGAYIGYSTIFFANKFPDAKIIAVEPNPFNYALLRENTVNYQNIQLINSGIWNKNKCLKIKNGSHDYWKTKVEEVVSAQMDSFEAVTIGGLLRNSGFKEIDILKLDVEGSEKEIFSDGYEEWLDKVKIILIELHDWLRPGCSEAVHAAINKYNFDQFKKGENTIFYNKKLISI